MILSLIVGLGELLWDVFPTRQHLGGAPANFAVQAKALRNEVAVVSCVGDDALGRRALELLKQDGLDVDCVSIEESHPTGTVNIQLQDGGSHQFEIVSDVAWDYLAWTPQLDNLAQRTGAVCFGSLAQRNEVSRSTILQFVQSCPDAALKVFDVNFRDPFVDSQVVLEALELANVLKLNDDELPRLAEFAQISFVDEEQALQAILERFALQAAALTRGSRGARIVSAAGEVADCPGENVKVVDSVGAGDAFSAALVTGLLNRRPLEVILASATQLAGYVCTQAGATPKLPSKLQAELLKSLSSAG